MKKKHARKIKDISEKLGEKKYVTYEWIPVSGEDLLLCGHKSFAGKKIEKEKMYEMKFPVFHSESFEGDLKRSFNKDRDEGLYQTVLNHHKKLFPEKHRNRKQR